MSPAKDQPRCADVLANLLNTGYGQSGLNISREIIIRAGPNFLFCLLTNSTIRYTEKMPKSFLLKRFTKNESKSNRNGIDFPFQGK